MRSSVQSAESYYHSLNQTFNDAQLKPSMIHTMLPRGNGPVDDITPTAAVVRSASFGDQIPTPRPARQGVTPTGAPFLLNKLDTGLPPRPQSIARPIHREAASSPAYAHHIRSSSMHQSSTSTTPRNQHSLATPDDTPPALLSVQSRPGLSRWSPASRTESFRTAREQWSSEEDDLQEQNHNHRIVLEGSASKLWRSNTGLGMDSGRDDEAITQTQLKGTKWRKDPSHAHDELNGTPAEELYHMSNQEWDSSQGKNVTVRRKALASRRWCDGERSGAVGETVPQLAAISSEEEDLGPQTPSPKWPERLSYHQIKHEKSNRLPYYPMSSTILEVTVVASPRRRRQTLRHTAKTLSLRSDADCSTSSSPVVHSNGTSLASEDMSYRRLNHKCASITAVKRKSSSDRLVGETNTPPFMLKHRRDSTALREVAEGFKRPVVHTHQSSGDLGLALPPGSLRRSEEGIRAIESLVPSNGDSFGRRSMKIESKSDGLAPAKNATQKQVRLIDGISSSLEPRSRNASADLIMRKSQDLPLPLRVFSSSAPLHPVNPVVEQLRYPRSRLSLDYYQSRQSMERITNEELPRPRSDKSMVVEEKQTSLDQSAIRIDEHAQARHLFAQTTPFSQTSSTHDPLEVSEATAINLYPHNNHSLLVVQQNSRTVDQTGNSANPFVYSLAKTDKPLLKVQSATPPYASLEFPALPNVDSPLKNPRKPPQIPLHGLQVPDIRVLAATPNQELEVSSFDDLDTRPKHLSRRTSLKQRARQYSDTVMRPLIAGRTSMRRSYHSRSRSLYQEGEFEQRNNLHPLWQPRSFWNEFDDSDSEFSDSGEDGARLPAGGDTSEVEEPRGLARVLEGFRASGGFLIGNSIGLERHGTNNRRHHLSLPVGLKRWSSARVVRKTSQATLMSLDSNAGVKRKGAGAKTRWKTLGLQFHYLGVRGMKQHLWEKRLEKRREKLRRSIGPRFMVEDTPVV